MSSLNVIAEWLDDLPEGDGKTIAKVLDSDPMPTDLKTGMEGFIIDSAWIWIAKTGGKVNGFLAASPMHGAVLVWRLVVREDSPLDTLPILLRQFVRDCKKRGYIGVFSYLDPKRKEEKLFMEALHKKNGTVFKKPQFLVAAKFDSLEKW